MVGVEDRIVVFESDEVRVVVKPRWVPGDDPKVYVGVELSGKALHEVVDLIPIKDNTWIGTFRPCPPNAEEVEKILTVLLSGMGIEMSQEKIKEIAREASAKAWAFKISEKLSL